MVAMMLTADIEFRKTVGAVRNLGGISALRTTNLLSILAKTEGDQVAFNRF
jgi:hypothetical protein